MGFKLMQKTKNLICSKAICILLGKKEIGNYIVNREQKRNLSSKRISDQLDHITVGEKNESKSSSVPPVGIQTRKQVLFEAQRKSKSSK